jgi:hypothetical protein
MTTWTPLHGPGGTVLAASGSVTAAAETSVLRVWVGADLVAEAAADQPNLARPRIVGQTVLWGQHRLDISDGTHRRLAPMAKILPGYEQTAHAWASDGHAAVVAARWIGPPGAPPSVVSMLEADGERQSTLWESPDVAPGALWFGDRAIVVGAPRVYDAPRYDGVSPAVRTWDADTSPFRIDGDDAGARVLVAEYAQLTVWHLATGEMLGRCAGLWIDAALTPDGTRVVTADSDGRVHVRHVAAGLPIVAEVSTDAPTLAVAATDARVVATFDRLPAIRTTALRP